jgi:tetratricopeptide (TPR) repeat protein
MATGRRAFSGAASGVIFDWILNRSPLRPTQLNPETPAALETIISRALEKTREALEKAYTLRDRVSERQKLHIAGWDFNMTGELDKAVEIQRSYIATHPVAIVQHNMLATAYNRLGRFEDAIAEADEAIRLGMNAYQPFSHKCRAWVHLNRFGEARDVAKQALARKLEAPIFHSLLYSIAFVLEDDAAIRQEIEWGRHHPQECGPYAWQYVSIAK